MPKPTKNEAALLALMRADRVVMTIRELAQEMRTGTRFERRGTRPNGSSESLDWRLLATREYDGLHEGRGAQGRGAPRGGMDGCDPEQAASRWRCLWADSACVGMPELSSWRAEEMKLVMAVGASRLELN
jgi:hypothetical protein